MIDWYSSWTYDLLLLLLPSSFRPKACCAFLPWWNSYPTTAREKPMKYYSQAVVSHMVSECCGMSSVCVPYLQIRSKQTILCGCIFFTTNRNKTTGWDNVDSIAQLFAQLNWLWVRYDMYCTSSPETHNLKWWFDDGVKIVYEILVGYSKALKVMK